jgi:pyrroloquinoline quinone biosynthesis protein D
MDPLTTATTTRSRVAVTGSDRPRLARHVRLSFCRTRQRHILQLPETVVVLHGSGAHILELCDGRRTVAEIVAELGTRYQQVPDDEVRRFLTRLVARRCVELPQSAENADG